MTKMRPGKHLTTGEVAKLCEINPHTAIRWIERGFLKAYQLPGRGDHRVLPKDLITFLTEYGMPIPEELQPSSRLVLIVEDEAPMARAIQRALKRAGFETMMAGDGFLAGALAVAFNPAVITLDLKMPGLGGLEVLKAIRDLPQLAGVKILIVSAMGHQLEEALEAGADGVLEKPFKNKELVEKVTHLADVDSLRQRLAG